MAIMHVTWTDLCFTRSIIYSVLIALQKCTFAIVRLSILSKNFSFFAVRTRLGKVLQESSIVPTAKPNLREY